MGQPRVILRPERVAIVRPFVGTELLKDIEAVSIVGGELVRGDGQFAVGFKAPTSVGLVLKSGHPHRLTDVQVIMIRGGEYPSSQMIGDAQAATPPLAITAPPPVELPPIKVGEIEQYLISKAKASKVVGGDDFEQFVHMQGSDHAALAAVAPFSRTNPPSSTSALMGGQVTLTPPDWNTGGLPIYSAEQQLALWNGNDAETVAITCSFGNVGGPLGRQHQNFPTLGSIGNRPVGIVRFGTRGYQLIAEVDIALSTQLTVNASYVALSAKLAGTDVTTVTGMLAFGTSVRTAPLTRTMYVNALTPLATQSHIPIPSFARSVLVKRLDNNNAGSVPNPAMTITVEDSTGSTIYYQTFATGTEMTVSLPISGNAYFVSITNGHAADYVDMMMIFELGL